MTRASAALRSHVPIRVLARPAFENRRWNPYNWLLYSHLRGAGVEVDESTRRRVLRGGYDVLHLHWPEQHLNQASGFHALRCTLTLLLQLWMVRRRGTKVLWTVHNLRSHDQRHPRLERWFWRLFTRQLDGYHCLTRRSRSAVLTRFPRLRRVPGHVVPHGHYRDIYPNEVSPESARRELGLAPEAKVVLFIGAVREYKNVPSLIDAFRGVNARDAVLLIAGGPADEPLRDEIASRAAGDSRVRLHLEFIPDEHLQRYLNAADVVALPYRDTLNSGSALLALSFDRPVLMPVSPSGEELMDSVGEEWVRLYDGALTSEVLEQAIHRACDRDRPRRAELKDFAWTGIAQSTARVYEALTRTPAAARDLPAEPDRGDAPLVSIVTPCYNAAPFVAETIESVRRQTHDAIEHIIVDDHSSDGSWEVISGFGDAVRPVRLAENRGGCHARNVGAGLARGRFLMFLDADDTIAPDTIEALLAAVRDEPGAIGYCDWRRLVVKDGVAVEEGRGRALPAAGEDPLIGWLTGVWVPPCAVLWRRDVYDRAGGWDEAVALNQDGDIMMRALADGARLVRAERGMGFYRKHTGARASVSSVGSDRKLRSAVGVLERLERRLEAAGTISIYRQAIGTAYQAFSLRAFQQSLDGLGRELGERARSYDGARAVARTGAGRLLTRVMGAERKEKLVMALAARGLATAERRATLQRRAPIQADANSAERRRNANEGLSRSGTERVAICVATYRRPEGLRRLLEALREVARDAAAAVEVVVVDNDAGASAKAVCDSLRTDFPCRLRYHVEPVRGISQARNRAVSEAAGADLIAFIDDDEVPDPCWLAELLRVRSEFHADIVTGPVLPVFEEPVPRWMRRGRFFDRPRFSTGDRLSEARTGNVLILRQLLLGCWPPFDERFGATGGEDTHFFVRAARAGVRIVWADEAVVSEHLPRTRTRAGWLLRRAFRGGTTWSLIAYRLRPAPRTRAIRVIKGMGRVGQGVVTLPFALVRGRAGLVSSGQRICLGVGSVAGALGFGYREYDITRRR